MNTEMKTEMPEEQDDAVYDAVYAEYLALFDEDDREEDFQPAEDPDWLDKRRPSAVVTTDLYLDLAKALKSWSRTTMPPIFLRDGYPVAVIQIPHNKGINSRFKVRTFGLVLSGSRASSLAVVWKEGGGWHFQVTGIHKGIVTPPRIILPEVNDCSGLSEEKLALNTSMNAAITLFFDLCVGAGWCTLAEATLDSKRLLRMYPTANP